MAQQIQQLIRLRSFEFDEKRRALADLLARADAIRGSRRDLELEVRNEQQAAAQSVEAGFGYADYAQNVIRRREKLQTALSEVETEIEDANEVVLDAYRELKKAEVTKQLEDAREAERLARLEQADLDEIAQNLHRRKHL